MKCKFVVNLLTATLIVTPVLVGCKKGSQHPTLIPNAGAEPTGEKLSGPILPPSKPIRPANVRTGDIKDVKPLPDQPLTEYTPNADIFKAQTVYFDFDKSTVKSSELSKIEEIARRMKSEFLGQRKALRIEGHCDERGTEEYNRALGERRALAVREALLDRGLPQNLVETISFGEDRPAVPGHNEAAWSKNRRGVFILLTPPTTTAKKD